MSFITRVSEGVLRRHYTTVTDHIRREQSNRNFARIVAGLDPTIAALYGCAPAAADFMQERLKAAVAEESWGLVSRLADELAGRTQPTLGVG